MAVWRRGPPDDGHNLSTAAKQKAYVARIAKHEVAALGFGTGFDHAEIPAAILDAAKKQDMPLFEVPYEMKGHAFLASEDGPIWVQGRLLETGPGTRLYAGRASRL